MAVKMDPLDGSSAKKSESRFDNVSDEDTFGISDGLLESDKEDGDESDSASIAPATSRQRAQALKAWHHPKFWESIRKAYPDANPQQVPQCLLEGMLDKLIFPMSYGVFVRILRRVLLVASFPLLPRYYAFRVGAGAEFDGCLSSALRNFMSHSTDVYDNNYMTENVREDIVRCRFGAFAGANDPLFDLLYDLTMHHLYVLVVIEARKTYFAEAAKLRSRGLPTTHLRSSTPPPCSDHATLDINGLVALFTGHSISDIGKPAKERVFDEGAEQRSEKAMAWLLSYTAKAWTLLSAAGSPAPEMIEEKPSTRPTCFICMSDFDQRGNLARHVKKQHLSALRAPFECPECARPGHPPHTIPSPHEWSNHTETVHGKMHAPHLTSELSSDCTGAQESATVHRCFVCHDGLPASRAGAIKHYGRHTTLLSSEQLSVRSAHLSRLRVRRPTQDTRYSST
ncbi:hypothetical protein MFIFM68171_02206 [Madurella fahalii]|uniref:C2H2-type domain-containing protein n=1 Tax=Madurella fahalii TaxID=1157608 RepID=A0ABQ0G2N3_9PEZI